ncbi:MAG: FAD-binding protein [Chloroflexi bacterium]|nr:FAD-binding protein [Chloroflexota bacterium]
MVSHDVIIVGGGLAGLRAAVETSQVADTALISKVHPLRSHSAAAQGGINAAIGQEDSWEIHAFDTIKGGDYLNDQPAVEILCQKGIEEVFFMEHLGTPFSRSEDGRIAQWAAGGQQQYRTCYAGDRTGQVLLHTLYEQALKQNLKVYQEWFVTSLIVEEGRCCGVIAMDIASGRLEAFRAKATIFCTGGYGRIYARTTNGLSNTGDGMAVAYRAQVPLQDMEFVQFHPTSLFGSNILVTEACRGEGAYLLNRHNERFLSRYAPGKMELAPRDIVSRSIETEILEGRGFPGGYVLLDLRHLGEKRITEKLGQVLELAKDFTRLNPIHEPIPIQPAQHYAMGGIPADVDGVTPRDGFYAAGECACVSVQGANRLGGNALLETLVFGCRVGQRVAQDVKNRDLPASGEAALAEEEKRLEAIKNGSRGERMGRIVKELTNTMWDKVGVFRDEKGLREAQDKIWELQDRYSRLSVDDKSRAFNTELVSALELGNMLTVAEVIVAGALTRQESRGGHFRNDYSQRDDKGFLHHTLAYKTAEGVRLERKEVAITRYQPAERTY